MIAFQVQDMSCGHCVGVITKALQGVDPKAQVTIDLATHRVQIESAAATPATLESAIREAGYSPVPTA